MHRSILVLLRFGDVVLKAHVDKLIEYFGLDICRSMIRCCCLELNTVESAHPGKVLADNLRTIFSENVRRDAITDEPMVKENFCSVCSCCFGCWDSSSQLGILIGADKFVLVTLRFLGNVPLYPLRQIGVVRWLTRAAAYADGGTWSRLLHSLDMCFPCGCRLRSCGSSKI